jgi:hypothetical protein
MEIVVEKLGYGFGPWNVLGSHVALEHRRALGISGLAYVLHQLSPDQRIQDGITKALAGIFELSNVKQIPIPTAQSTGRTSLLEFSGGASAEPRLQPEKRSRKRVTVSRHRHHDGVLQLVKGGAPQETKHLARSGHARCAPPDI